jgi:hypothetical protein
MFIWATVLFCLGVAAFLDNIFAFGEIFRKINTVMFMLVSLGLLLESKQIRKKQHNQTNYSEQPEDTASKTARPKTRATY